MRQNWVRFQWLTVLWVAAGCGSAWAAAIPVFSPDSTVVPPRPETRTAWRVSLPLRSIDSIKSYHLVEGYLYAIGDEGSVHCVRADTGQLLWSRRLMNPPGTIYPPVAYRSPEFYAVAFTLSTEVVLLDPNTGSEYKRVRLSSPAGTSCSVSPGFVYAAETNRHLRAYGLKDTLPTWLILTNGPLSVPPLYQADLETLLLADMTGLVAMVWADDKEQVYACKLGGEPQGAMAVDEKSIYVATSDNLVNCLDRLTGETLWQYRLPAKPRGGPLLHQGNIYQAVSPRGVQRVSINRDRPNWFDPDAVQFLAEWGGLPVMLHADGRVAILDSMTGQPLTFVQAGSVAHAVSNTANEALLLVSPMGEIRCVQSINANPAALSSFRPTTTQPTTQPTTRPALTRAEKVSEEVPLWIRSSGAAQQGTGTGVTRSDRSGRGDRSARSSRSSSRGDRGSSRSSRGSRSDRGSRGGRSSRSSRGY